MEDTPQDRIGAALQCISDFGGTDGEHHKMWTLDQVVRILTGCPTVIRTGTDYKGESYVYDALGESDEYLEWVQAYRDGEDGPETYSWDEGTAP